MSSKAHLIVVGKLKSKALEEIEADYLKRLVTYKLTIHEVKASSEVLKKVQEISKGSPARLIALAENGEEFTSEDFSKQLFKNLEKTPGKLIFIIAGAYGHCPTVTSAASEKLSLSKLTFPHKIARILFVEQFYRAVSIKEGHPYHN